MQNITKYLLTLCVSILVLTNLVFANDKEEFKIIVNASNSLSRMTKEEISNMFLKKLTRWKDTNQLVYPVDLLEDSLVREVFSKEIHGRKVSSIKAYWQRQIFSGRELPPPEKESEQDVLKYIEQKTRAIGYISKSTEIKGYNVKDIEIVEE